MDNNDGIPLFPRKTDNHLECAKWEDAFMDFLLTKGAARTARNGEASSYPSRVEEAIASTVTETKKAGMTSKKKIDKEANGKLFGWLCKATKDTAPSIYTLIRKDKTIFDPNVESKEEGVGNKAWEKITKHIADLSSNDESVLDAVDERDDFATNPITRYCTTEEWDDIVEAYMKLNDACGHLAVDGAALVLRLQSLLPVEFRRGLEIGQAKVHRHV